MRSKNNLRRIRTMPKRLSALTAAVVLLLGIVIPVVAPQSTQAAQLQSRSLTISSSANGGITTNVSGVAAAAGSGGNGQKTSELFTFNIATTGNVGSILIQYCDDPIPQDPCLTGGTISSSNIPGFDSSNVASIVSQTGWSANNFTLDTTTVLTGSPYNCAGSSPGRTNCIAVKRGAAASETSGGTVTLKFGGLTSDYITNPTVDNRAFFARVTTYSDTSYTTQQDYGTVVGSTAQQIDITAKVKEVLNFSVGDVTALVAPGGTCTALGAGSNGALALGDANGVLSFTQAYDTHSYFRLSTNTNGGVIVYYSGDTLKNGTNQINPAGTGSSPNITAVSSTVNSSQFGLAVDSSDTQGGNGYSFTSLVAPNGSPTDYSSGAGTITTGGSAKFAFDTGSITTPVKIASSSGPVACDTGSVRYLGNISTATPAGIYTTTITYIATGTY
jgi:hypothetical protein